MGIHPALRDEAPDVYPWWRARLERPLYLLVGRRGRGKTMLAADIVLHRMRRGERCYSNVAVTDWKRGLRAGHVGSLLDLVELESASVVIDEANKWASAREWAAMPSSVLSSWQESRKAGLSLVFTTQHESRVDVVLRQLVDEVGLCSRLPWPVPRRLPLFRIDWCALEDCEAVRRMRRVKRGQQVESVDSRVEFWWAGVDSRFAYSTYSSVAEVDKEALKAYLASVKHGMSHEASVEFCGVAERVEPSRFDPVSRLWVPWGDGRSLL